jgi:hypothetical protein
VLEELLPSSPGTVVGAACAPVIGLGWSETDDMPAPHEPSLLPR